MDAALVAVVRARLAEHADPVRAEAQRAYMKSVMPYRGLTSPVLRALCRDVFAAHPLPSFSAWRDTALELWRRAAYREERYAAQELIGDRRYRAYRTLAAVPVYEEMIASGAWWDLVDPVASDWLGELLRSDAASFAPLLRAWAEDGDMWKRRSAIIAQVKLKELTDRQLLYECIEPNLADRRFFIRKAVGWALRALAWTDPEEVRRYVAAHRDRLSGLSRREAERNLTPASDSTERWVRSGGGRADITHSQSWTATESTGGPGSCPGGMGRACPQRASTNPIPRTWSGCRSCASPAPR